MNDHSLVRLLHRFTPATSAQWVIAGCVLGLLAGLYLWSLAWAYSMSRRSLPRRRAAIAATALAGLSWPVSLLLIRVVQSPPSSRPLRTPLGRRLWLAAPFVASVVAVGAILDWRAALGVTAMAALALCTVCSTVCSAAILASLAIVVAIANHMDTVPGVIAWGVAVLGMLALVARMERRQPTRIRTGGGTRPES